MVTRLLKGAFLVILVVIIDNELRMTSMNIQVYYKFFTWIVSSILKFILHIFTIKKVISFPSKKLCQDPLEKLFGMQRQRGATNENQTAAQFTKNANYKEINLIWL